MKNRSLLIAMLAVALSWSVQASAKGKGFYFGGSIGSADVSVDNLNFDENDFA